MKSYSIVSIFSVVLSSLAGAVVLAACGGGGDGAVMDEEAGSAVDAAQDRSQSLVGTYWGVCAQSKNVSDPQNGSAAIYERVVYVVQPKASDDRYPTEVEATYYRESDCSGSPLHKLAVKGGHLKIDGRADVFGKSAMKVSEVSVNPFPGLSAANILINGLRFGQKDYSLPHKDVWYVDGDNRVFKGDFSKPLDGEGYPTAIESAYSARKT